MDIYRAAKRFSIYKNSEIIYTKKFNLDDFFTCHACKPRRHSLSNCSEVNSTGYSEFDEPVSALSTILVYTNSVYVPCSRTRVGQ